MCVVTVELAVLAVLNVEHAGDDVDVDIDGVEAFDNDEDSLGSAALLISRSI
jgi:hypothetical protein